MTDNVHPMWTDGQLDAALATLHNPPAGRPDLVAAKAALSTALEPSVTARPSVERLVGRAESATRPPSVEIPGLERPLPVRRPARRWSWAAAAVVVIIGGVALAETVLSGPEAPTAAAAAPTLRQAAIAAIREQDKAAGPDQYTYVWTDTWALRIVTVGRDRFYAKQVEMVSQTWVPTDRSRDWLVRSAPTGRATWVVGSAATAGAAGVPAAAFRMRSSDSSAPCGDFSPSADTVPSCADPILRPGWTNPTPAWLAGLPTDPQGMLRLLHTDAAVNSRGDAELVTYVDDALRTGLVPAEVRAVMYQALALLPDLTVTQRVTNLAGRTGVAMGVDEPGYADREDIIVDPTTGQYIGDRTVQLVDHNGIKAGTVTNTSATTTAVADTLGEPPN